MKKALQYILIVILFSFWGIVLTNQETFRGIAREVKLYINKPCTKPIEYAIGQVDPKFSVSKDQLDFDLESAEKVWEGPAGRNLFQYNPNAQLKINLVFDERQKQTIEAGKMENDLKSLENIHESTLKEYDSLSSSYKQRLAIYNNKVAGYESRLNKYNKDVEYWNSRGGAPQDEFNNLKKEKKELGDIFSNLEKERVALNSLASKTNNIVEKENTIVDKYNSNLETYRSKFGESREFEKGVYNGQEINIYEFKENTDLALTIVHEFGHALGIDHLTSPQSIMYYLMGEQDLENPKLTEEDLAALKGVCRLR